MKFSEQWLRQWVNPAALDTTALTEQMAMLGLTVDAITPVAGQFSGVVIGEVVTCVKHPNAEKLSCCEVNIGKPNSLKIVCGASNVRAGLKVAVATIGAVLPNNFKINEAKLRGELSQGMLCSAKELQLELGKSVTDGILELPQDANIGDDFNVYFKGNDHIIDVDITPNRGDALSIRGLARDLAAALHLNFTTSSTVTDIVTITDTVTVTDTVTDTVTVTDTTSCPRYIARIIRNVNNTLQTPSYMQQALQRANVRLINPIVDITNYVMLELGQPMHAYDLSKIKGNITVRRANESGAACDHALKLLDEQEITLTQHDLIIADDEKPLALAGIMGGMDSGVSVNTRDILLEAAFFTPKNICLSKRRHNISSDSSHRFERGVDFNLPVEAIARATQLILEITHGVPEDIIEIVSAEALPKREKIILERDQIKRILGITISDVDIIRILESLKMTVKPVQNGFEVIPPSFRFDMTLPIDLIEELARMIGYNAILATEMSAPLIMQPHTENNLSEKHIKQFLVDRDYHEAVTYSFISPELFSLFSPKAKAIALKNPISQDMSVMRDSLLPGLLQAIQMNVRHQCERVRLFETGLCFSDESQIQKLALVATGNVYPEQWSEKNRIVDFYDLKADLTALFPAVTAAALASHPALHPGRSCMLQKNGKQMGYLGEIHPHILNYFDIKQPVIVCEVTLPDINQFHLPYFQAFSRFPSVRRDLAIVVDEAISFDTICQLITAKAGKQLQDVLIFDVYQGKNIETNKKSIALGLTFQDSSRTLIDEEINAIIHDVVTVLERELKATLRT